MIDKREAILSRMHAVLDEVAAGMRDSSEDPRPRAGAFRNKLDFSETVRPAFIILDGDENADQGAFDRGRAPPTANPVRLTPEVYVLDSEVVGDAVGTRLNLLRRLVVKAMLTDATLTALAGTNGAIQYDGCATGLSLGRSLEGEAVLNFTVVYVLRPSDL